MIPPSPSDLERYLGIALAAARDAGSYLLEGWRRGVTAEHKGRVDLVTEFDRRSEKLLRARLGDDTSLAVLGEEDGGSINHAEPAWIVDPVDGTTNFVHGHFFFCVSIGLVLRGKPLLGVVVAPALKTEWIGIVGSRATRNGEACHVSTVGKFDDALLATGFPYDRNQTRDNNFDAFVAIKKRCQAVRRCGSAALDLCLVADGTYDGYWERRLRPWDLAGGAAIVLAAGGHVTEYDGSALDFATGNTLASNGCIHSALITELAEVARDPSRASFI